MLKLFKMNDQDYLIARNRLEAIEFYTDYALQNYNTFYTGNPEEQELPQAMHTDRDIYTVYRVKPVASLN